jgi:hypothetical protein
MNASIVRRAFDVTYVISRALIGQDMFRGKEKLTCLSGTAIRQTGL